MASFTDSPMNFNPYIQQLPVEAMTKVGLELQRRYDEGVQRIQQSIDKVAGLDIVRPQDKAYLQNKLNSFGNKLRFVSAGDFSNYQLVNTISGMASDVGKDPNVSNAVSSSAWYRKGIKDMEKAKSEGKSSPANEYDFVTKAEEWFNNPEVGSKFSHSYTPYIDVQKKWFDVFKSLHSDVREEDIPYERNADGSINYNRTAAAMQRVSKEYVSAEKIENALRASLSPTELNQLNIDARYRFKDLTPQQMADNAYSKYKTKFTTISERISELEGAYALSGSNPEKRIEINKMIDFYKKQKDNISASLNEDVSYIQNNFDGAKEMFYRNSAIEQFANAFAWENNKANVMTNPVFEAEMKLKNYALDVSKYNLDVRKQNWDEKMDTEKLKLETQKAFAKFYGTSSGFTTYLGTSTKIKDAYGALLQDKTDLQAGVVSALQDIAKNTGISYEQLEAAKDRYKGGKVKEWWKGENLKDNIPIQLRDDIEQIARNEKKAEMLDRLSKDIKAEVDTEFLTKQQTILNKIKGLKGISLSTEQGVVQFSPEELAEYAAKISVPTPYMGSSMYVTYKTPLTEKEKFLTRGLSGEASRVFSEISSLVTEAYEKLEEEKYAEINRRTKEKVGTYIPKLSTVVLPVGEEGKEARAFWESTVNGAASRYTGLGGVSSAGGEEEFSAEDASTLKTWMSSEGKGNIQYSTVTQGEKTYIVVEKEGKQILLPLEASEAAQLPKSPSTPTLQETEVIQYQQAFNGSTNPTGEMADAFYSYYDMPNTTLNVAADLKQKYKNPAIQYLTFHLLVPNIGVVSCDVEKPLSVTNAELYIRELTDKQVKDIYLKNPNISEQTKQIIQTL